MVYIIQLLKYCQPFPSSWTFVIFIWEYTFMYEIPCNFYSCFSVYRLGLKKARLRLCTSKNSSCRRLAILWVCQKHWSCLFFCYWMNISQNNDSCFDFWYYLLLYKRRIQKEKYLSRYCIYFGYILSFRKCIREDIFLRGCRLYLSKILCCFQLCWYMY